MRSELHWQWRLGQLLWQVRNGALAVHMMHAAAIKPAPAALAATQNRFNQGIDSLPAITVQTAEQCAQACNADKYCAPAA